MQKGDYLSSILRSGKTVLSTKDIALMWQDLNPDITKVRLNYFVKKGDLCQIRRGIYSKEKNYDKLELATKIFIPSYVSFETVLAREGLIFQFQTQITVATYTNREITIEDQVYSFRKLKDQILSNAIGIEHIDETSIATKERAFLDTLYTKADYFFDNTRSLDWDRVFAMLPIYNNKRLVKSVNKLFKKI